MSWVQIFKKQGDNLEQYLSSIKTWVQLSKQYNLIPDIFLDILYNKICSDIQNWTMFPRQDLLYFGENIKTIISDIIYIEEFKKKINSIVNWERPDLEKCFEIISTAHDESKKIKDDQINSQKDFERKEKLNHFNKQAEIEQKQAQAKLDELLSNL